MPEVQEPECDKNHLRLQLSNRIGQTDYSQRCLVRMFIEIRFFLSMTAARPVRPALYPKGIKPVPVQVHPA